MRTPQLHTQYSRFNNVAEKIVTKSVWMFGASEWSTMKDAVVAIFIGRKLRSSDLTVDAGHLFWAARVSVGFDALFISHHVRSNPPT
jgi:hypothetical protein